MYFHMYICITNVLFEALYFHLVPRLEYLASARAFSNLKALVL